MDLLGDNRLRGQGGDDRLLSGAGADRLDGDGGSDRLDGGPGDDLMEGGPGYDGLRGGAGDDHLSDGSLGSDLLEGGPGDDLIRSAPRGMDRVRCGSGQDRVEADWWDIVAPDCEVVTRPEADPRLGPEAGTLLPVYSLRGELLGSTGSRRLSETGGPLRLLWANNGHLYLESAFRGAGHCFIALTPSSGGRSECNDARGLARGGSMFVRRAGGASYRWFAFAPAWARTLQVGARRVPVWDGVAVFVAGRRPGPVIARGDGRTLGLNVP
jgi:hypothetical protein